MSGNEQCMFFQRYSKLRADLLRHLAFWSLANDHCNIAASGSIIVHTYSSSVPAPSVRRHFHIVRLQRRYLGVEFVEARLQRHATFLNHQDCFNDGGSSRSGFRVANVRFYGAKEKGIAALRVSKNLTNTFAFNRISNGTTTLFESA